MNAGIEGRVVAVSCLHQTETGDLPEVILGPSTVAEAASEAVGEQQMLVDQLVSSW